MTVEETEQQKNLKVFRNDNPNETSNVNGSNQKKKNSALLLHSQIQPSHFSITLVFDKISLL